LKLVCSERIDDESILEAFRISENFFFSCVSLRKVFSLVVQLSHSVESFNLVSVFVRRGYRREKRGFASLNSGRQISAILNAETSCFSPLALSSTTHLSCRHSWLRGVHQICDLNTNGRVQPFQNELFSRVILER